MSDSTRFVECSTHGTQVATYVCRHTVETLRDGKPRGFWSAEAKPGDQYPDSWCTACEERVNAAGEWNDENEKEAGVTLICSECYMKAKAINNNDGVAPSNPSLQRTASRASAELKRYANQKLG